MSKKGYVYILASKRNGVLYIGVTSNLIKRIYEHKSELIEGFTKRYHIKRLVYFEIYENMYDAISREKQLKSGSRENKVALIENKNKYWEDLYDTIL